MKPVPLPLEVARQAQIELVARMRYAHPMHPTPLQFAQRLQEANNLLSQVPPGSRLQFFLQPNGSLGGQTPLQALAAGLHHGVMASAAAFADI